MRPALAVILGLLMLMWCVPAPGADLSAKSGGTYYSESRTPTVAIKVDTREITDKSSIMFMARKGGFVFVNVLTDVPIVNTVALTDSTTVQVASGAFFERNYQCSLVEFKVLDGKKIARLVDVDGKEYTYPAPKVLRVWKGDAK